MRFSKRWRLVAFTGALVGSAGMVVAAATATGAYFNDTQSGQVSGNFGSIKVTTGGGSGTDNLDFSMTNMLPGQWQTITVHYTNTGLNTEDVYLVFNNAQALHSVNNLGTYGAAKIMSDGSTIFYSTNLDDGLGAGSTLPLPYIPANSSHCSAAPGAQVPLSSAGEGTASPGCWPIPTVLKLASDVKPNQSGTMTFSFAPGPKFNGASLEGAPFFCYPLIQNPTDTGNPTDQVCTGNPSYGLPYQIVATQPGVAPSDPYNTTPTP